MANENGGANGRQPLTVWISLVGMSRKDLTIKGSAIVWFVFHSFRRARHGLILAFLRSQVKDKTNDTLADPFTYKTNSAPDHVMYKAVIVRQAFRRINV